ncbi:glycosyltransferase family 2 protein [Clostridium sp.]|uniref:glycosyltransferase family 2 protein n=1 Tax=Clostridium sp. TaxID=1506 RepID=UPI002B260A79|nr:glycosyltransferase [Clostridium sp.]
MSVYNTSEDILKQALESIINQSYKNIEIIIVNDCSDRDYDFIKDYNDKRIKILKNKENKGLTYSLNYAIKNSHGEYIARMDSDDIAYPTRIAEQIKYMEEHQEIGVLGTRAKDFGQLHNLRGAFPGNPQYINVYSLFNCSVTHPTVMIRKSFLENNNLQYNEEYRNSQDYELWSRCFIYGDVIAELPKCLLYYRISETQISSKNNNSCQQQNARKIRESQIERLKIYPNKKEIQIHNFLSEGVTDDEVFMKEVLAWCDKLISSNNEYAIYNNKMLQIAIAQQLLAVLSCTSLKEKYTLHNCCRVVRMLRGNIVLAFTYKVKRRFINLFIKKHDIK